MRITSDKRNFAKLLCNLEKLGYINHEEVFPKVSIREFYSDKYNRNNLVVENGTTWKDIQAASEGGNPCLSYSSFQNLIKLLNNAGLLHNTNKEAKDIEEMFDKARVSLWTGRQDQSMISIYVPGENTEKPAPEVDTGLGFLTEADTPAEKPEDIADVAAATTVATGAVNPDDIPTDDSPY